MEIPFSVDELGNLQTYFVDMIKRRMDTVGDQTLKVHRDASFTENPMEREDVEETIKVGYAKLAIFFSIFGSSSFSVVFFQVKSLVGFNEIYPTLLAANPTLQWIHDPVVEDKAPAEEWFDKLVATLKDEPASTQCIFSCQMGRGRTTLGKKLVKVGM